MAGSFLGFYAFIGFEDMVNVAEEVKRPSVTIPIAIGLAMLLATACQTRRQAQTVANTVILVLSALGGSMVPRFFMPQSLQDLGWLTPNTWALEAYSGIFWRGDTLAEIMLPIALLTSTGLVGWWASRWLAKRQAYGD